MRRLAIVLACTACGGGPGTLDDGGVNTDPAPISWSELPPSSTDPTNDSGLGEGCYPCRDWVCGTTRDLPDPDAIYVDMHPTTEGCALTRIGVTPLSSMKVPTTCTTHAFQFLRPGANTIFSVTLKPQGGALELCTTGSCRSCIPWR